MPLAPPFRIPTDMDEVHVAPGQLTKIEDWYYGGKYDRGPYVYPFDQIMFRIDVRDNSKDDEERLSKGIDRIYVKFLTLDDEFARMVLEDRNHNPVMIWRSTLQPSTAPADRNFQVAFKVVFEWADVRFGVVETDMLEHAVNDYWGMALVIMSYMAHHKDDATVVKSTTQRLIKTKNGHKGNGKRTVYVRRVIYQLLPRDTHSKTRQFTRHVESWNVHGHWRNYKSGKRSWVKPYTKGKGRLETKIYKVQ